MKIKNILCIVFLLLVTGLVTLRADADSIFNHKITAKEAAKNLPEFSDTSCKFSQDKIIKSSASECVTLKSKGNFKFEKDKGVTFETTYPVKSVTSYTSSQNKHVSSIVKALANKNYTYLEKNFDIYFLQTQDKHWELALKPKKDSKAAAALKVINIHGKSKIDKMIIDTQNSKTTINYTDCK